LANIRWRQSLGICRSVFHAQHRRRSRRQQQDVDVFECATGDRLPILLDCTQVTKLRHVKRPTGSDDFVAERPQRLSTAVPNALVTSVSALKLLATPTRTRCSCSTSPTKS
jgi:hypothetical protein